MYFILSGIRNKSAHPMSDSSFCSCPTKPQHKKSLISLDRVRQRTFTSKWSVLILPPELPVGWRLNVHGKVEVWCESFHDEKFPATPASVLFLIQGSRIHFLKYIRKKSRNFSKSLWRKLKCHLRPSLICVRWVVEGCGSQNQTIKVLQFVREKIFIKEESGAIPVIIENSRNSEWQCVDKNVKGSRTLWLEEHCIENLT